MQQASNDDTYERKRVGVACHRCRRQKIKCSGSKPCKTCSNRGVNCEFGAEDRKVVISENALNDLRKRLRDYERHQQRQSRSNEPPSTFEPFQPKQPASANADQQNPDTIEVPRFGISSPPEPSIVQDHDNVLGTPSRDETAISDQSILPNPLAPDQPAFIPSSTGRQIYLGTSSTWAFSRQVLDIARHSPFSNPSTETTIHVDGETYGYIFEDLKLSPADMADLPSLEMSLYLMQTVKFRTHPLFSLFDEENFTFNLRCFYENPLEYASDNRLWYVHYLLIMAFGKAFTVQISSISVVAGSRLFSRALRLLPDISQLCVAPVEAIEVLCCVILYLQSTDHRTAAYAYIGQALRMSFSNGLHRDLQADSVGDHLAHRGRRIWWTVYALDRRLSSSMGLPNSLRDESMSDAIKTTSDTDISMTGLLIHVKICKLFAKVCDAVYGAEGKLDKNFVITSQTILRGIADVEDELQKYKDRCFGEISRVAAHLMLAYHQCIVVTTRPFMFHLLKLRLERTRPRPLSLSASGKGMVEVCIDSAMRIVTVLSQLKDHNLLDSFLPFDLESAFSAGFVLLMASCIHPKLIPSRGWYRTIMSTFNEMIGKGNSLASQRKSEVEDLANMLSGLSTTSHHRSDSHLQPFIPTLPTPIPSSALPSGDSISLPSLDDPFFEDWNAGDGLSGAQIMDLADALEFGNIDDLWQF